MLLDVCLKRLCEVLRKTFDRTYDLRVLRTFSGTLIAGNPAFGIHLPGKIDGGRLIDISQVQHTTGTGAMSATNQTRQRSVYTVGSNISVKTVGQKRQCHRTV